MSNDLLDLVRELNTLNDDNLVDRVIANNDVQWCLSELQDILEAEQHTLTPGCCKDCDNWDEEYSAGRKNLNNYVCHCHEWSNPEVGFYRFTSPNDYCSYFEPKEALKGGKDRGV